jgi:uncharacterized FlaG/YvyC family protein
MNPLPPIDLAAKPGDQAAMTRTVVAAVRALNKSQLLGDEREMSFARDQDTQKMVIRIVARGTGEVLDQIPAEQMLRILEDLRLQGKDGEKP